MEGHCQDTIQYNTIQYNTIQYNTIQYNTIQYNTIQYNTIQYNTIQYNTIQYSFRDLKAWNIREEQMKPTAPQRKALVIEPSGNWPRGGSRNRWEINIPKCTLYDTYQQFGGGQVTEYVSIRPLWQNSQLSEAEI